MAEKNYYNMKEYSRFFDNPVDKGKKFKVVDGDSIYDEQGGGYRIRGYDTDEVDHGRAEDVTSRTWVGEVQTDVLDYLVKNGWDTIQYTGESDNRNDDGPSRKIINLINPKTNQSTADVMYYQGLIDLKGGTGPFAGKNISERHLKLYRQGKLARSRGETNKNYDSFRARLNQAEEKDVHFVKGIASTEEFYNDKFDRGVYVRNNDRTIDNRAKSPLKSSFSGGVDTLNAGFWGLTEMVGNRVGFNHLEDSAREYKEANLDDVRALPVWTNDIQDVHSFKDFTEWTAGAAGGSAPFLALMAAGFIPGAVATAASFGSMALVYTGMTINDMEGDISKKSFTTALSAGLGMATFERLGGQAIFGAFKASSWLSKEGNKKAIKQYAKYKNVTFEEAKASFAIANKGEMINMLSDIKRNDLVWKIWAKSVAGRTASGVVGEGITETAQEGLQYSAAYWGSEQGKGVFDKEEFKNLLINSAAAGGFLGGALGGGIGAVTEDSPASLRVRQAKWAKGMNKNINTENPIDIQSTLQQSSQNFLEGTEERYKRRPVERDSEGKIIGFREANQKEIDKDLEKFTVSQKIKSTLARAKEILFDNEAFGTGYNVLTKPSRVGPYLDGSETLRAEVSFSGWVTDRTASGQSHVQNKKYFQGRQHAIAHDVVNRLRVALKISGDTHSNRNKAFKVLAEYAAIFKAPLDVLKPDVNIKADQEKLNKFFKENNLKFDKDTMQTLEGAYNAIVNRYEAEQDGIYKQANSKYNPDKGHTFNKRKLSPEKIAANKQAFKAKLKKNGYTDEMADQELDFIENVPGGYDINEYANTEFLTKKPIGLKKRDNKRIYYDPSDTDFKEFWEEQSYDTLLLRGTEVAHYTADTIATGFGGDKLNSKILTIRDELTESYGKEIADRWMPEITTTIYNHYRAHRGEYHKITNDNLRAMYANAGAMMALAYMPLAVVSSIPELSLAFLGADAKMFRKAVKEAGKMAGQGLVEQMKKIADSSLTKSERQYALDVMRSRGMLTHEFGAGSAGAHVIDADYGNDGRKIWLQKKVMPGFYKITLLTPFTTAVRMIRGSVANDWLAENMAILDEALYTMDVNPEDDSEFIKRDPKEFNGFTNKQALAFKKIREMGGNPREIVIEQRELEQGYSAQTKLLADAIQSNIDNNRTIEEDGKVIPYAQSQQRIKDDNEVNKEFSEWLMTENHSYKTEAGRRAIELSRKIDLIRQNFVDSALVNPDPGKRPLFYSDGRVRLLVLFQGYLSTFSAQIIIPMLRNLANKGSPQDQINAASVMMGTIFLGFIGQAIKDEIKYGDSPVWLSDAEYFQRGVQASGLMGQTERAMNLFFPLYSSEEDSLADRAWAEIGPASGTIDSVAKAMSWAMEGEGEKALNKALKVSPGIGVFTSLRQKAAKEIADSF
jgi:hypothetical protein